MTKTKANTNMMAKNEMVKGEIEMTMNIEELKQDYVKAVKALEEVKQKLDACEDREEEARQAKADYRQQVVKELHLTNPLELVKHMSTDKENLRLLKIVNNYAADTALHKTALNCAKENLGHAVHNIMVYEMKNNLEKLAKYSIGGKRFIKCFTIGKIQGFYWYGEAEKHLPLAMQNMYLDFDRYVFGGELKTDWIKEYKPYQIYTAAEILADVTAAAEYRKQLDEKLKALQKEIEMENSKRKFNNLKINGAHILSINHLDRY